MYTDATAVSYTHLDVYKRQGLYIFCEFNNTYKAIFKNKKTTKAIHLLDKIIKNILIISYKEKVAHKYDQAFLHIHKYVTEPRFFKNREFLRLMANT